MSYNCISQDRQNGLMKPAKRNQVLYCTISNMSKIPAVFLGKGVVVLGVFNSETDLIQKSTQYMKSDT